MSTSVTVVGAGIAGLSCAFDLARAGLDVRVLDARPEPGGVMRTTERDGFQFEEGPNSIPGSAAGFLELCADAGVADRIVQSTPSAKTRFLFFRGRLVALPMGPGQLLGSPLLSVRGKLRLVSEPWRRWRDTLGDDPDFDTFLTDRFGREVARTLGGSFVRGIYASESTELGTASAFPRLWDMVQAHGGVLRGLKNSRKAKRAAASAESSPSRPAAGAGATQLVSLDGGLGSLPDALAAELGPRLRLDTPVRSVEPDGARWRTTTAAGEILESERVVLATSAGATARLLGPASTGNDGSPEGARPSVSELAEVTHASVCVVSLGFARDFLPDGFGFLVPPDEDLRGAAPRALGILFVSKMFAGRAPRGSAAISAIYRAADTEGKEEDELVELAREDLGLALPGETIDAPAVVHVRRWDDAIPRYAPGHRARVERVLARVAEETPGLDLIGNWVGGVSIDDRIRRGREAAQRTIETSSPAAAAGGRA